MAVCKPNTEQVVKEARCIHGNKYDYSLVEYKNAKTKIKIVCVVHGIFEQRVSHHLNGHGCSKCGHMKSNLKQTKTTKQFIIDAKKTHGDKYDYSMVKYKTNLNKVKIICSEHGVFEQTPSGHLQGKGCLMCKGHYKKKYYTNNIPIYDTYQPQLEPYGVECRRSPDDKNILEVGCWYDGCNKWFKPLRSSVLNKINAIKGQVRGENNLYCSDECKYRCSTFGQRVYRKGEGYDTYRTHQAELRSILIEERGTVCEKCGIDVPDGIICHHILPVKIDPLESLDKDNCILVCSDCDSILHQKDGCKTGQLAYC